MLPLHVLSGFLALVFGYVALVAVKGGWLHRRSGMGFVAAMATMGLTGAYVAYLVNTPTSVVAGLLSFYLVATALLTVRRVVAKSVWVDAGAMLFVCGVALLGFVLGVERLNPLQQEAVAMLVFGTVGLVGAAADLRMIRDGGIGGSRRIRRHLWRMCFALFIAAASFFLGPQRRIPEVMRVPALLPIPVLLVLVLLFYWLWRWPPTRSVRSETGAAN
jgi:uncharacterized membrane protein